MSEEDPTGEEIRARAEKARAKRVAERAARKAEEEAAEEKKGKRRWWNWLIDVALVSAAAYLIWVRFIRKDEQPDAPSTKPSVSASASATTTRALKAGTELRAGAGPMFASVETIATPTTFETVEAPLTPGWTKVKLPSGAIGWVPVDAVASIVLAPPPSASASPSASTLPSAPASGPASAP